MANFIRFKHPLSLTTLILSTLITGCDWRPDLSMASDADSNKLATLNHTQHIETADLSTSDQIKLYNLKYQLNELTLSATRENIEKHHNSDDLITWLPAIPEAPEVSIDIEPSWMIEQQAEQTDTATITIDLACTYASRPCTEIINQIDEWRPILQQSYTIRYFDLPQNYHRLGVESAAVVSCLNGDAKKNMQTFLWQRQGQVDMAALTGAIDLYSSDPSETYQCMSSNETLKQVQGNIQYLKELGLNLTPTVIINGKYVSRGYEQRELFSQLFSALKFETMDTSPQVEWIQSWTTPEKKQNWALVEHQGQILRVTTGVNLGDYWIAGITENGLSLVKNNQIASLSGAAASIAANEPHQESNATSLYAYANDQEDDTTNNTGDQKENFTPSNHKERYEHVISQLKAVPLPQDWLEEQLMRQSELEESLHLTESQIEGKSLVKLNRDEIDDFYTSLGMKPGDVIVRVNDEWIHEENNTLFQTFANEEKVTISVMRKGLPVHFAFEAQ